MTNTNTLTLRKCAYIFDSTYGTYFCGTKEQHAQRAATQRTLKEYYDHPGKRLEHIPYSIDNGGNITIILNDQPHRLNALQIAHINGDPNSVINHRRHITTEAVAKKTALFHQWTSKSLYSNKFRTLEFEFFTGVEDLGYIRVNFKGHSERFIIDDRTGELFTSGEHGHHQPTTAECIRKRLEIQSEKAKAEFYEIINIITEV